MKYLIAILIIVSLIFFGAISYYTVARLETPRPPESVVQGKQVWQREACVGCHTLFGNGSYMGSDLTKTMSVRSPEWVRRFFTERPVMPPSTTKRHPGLRPEEAEKIVQFLLYVDKVKTHGWPPNPIQKHTLRDYGITVEE